jgi:hypothetical protein
VVQLNIIKITQCCIIWLFGVEEGTKWMGNMCLDVETECDLRIINENTAIMKISRKPHRANITRCM